MMMDNDQIYLTKENAPAVAADTGWTLDQLLRLIEEDPESKWKICISGIRLEDC